MSASSFPSLSGGQNSAETPSTEDKTDQEQNRRKRNNNRNKRTPKEIVLQESKPRKQESNRTDDLRRKEQMGEAQSDPEIEEDDDDEEGEDNDKQMVTFDISKVSQSTLRETLIRSLKKKKVDCPICYDKIGVRSSMWSCVQCYHPFHLECMKKWIVNSNKDKKQ